LPGCPAADRRGRQLVRPEGNSGSFRFWHANLHLRIFMNDHPQYHSRPRLVFDSSVVRYYNGMLGRGFRFRLDVSPR